ncbi:MAG: spore gernimation protein GerPD [Bacilli bacterium]
MNVQLHVVNRELIVGCIDMMSVSTSATFIIGDAFSIYQRSRLDTPPESLYVGPFVPLSLS